MTDILTSIYREWEIRNSISMLYDDYVRKGYRARKKLEKITERLVLNCVNHPSNKHNRCDSNVYNWSMIYGSVIHPDSEDYRRKFVGELNKAKIPEKMQQREKLIQQLWNLIYNELSIKSRPKPLIILTDRMLKCGGFETNVTTRIRLLLTRYSLEQVAEINLAYSSMFPGGQVLAFRPCRLFEKHFEKNSIRVEGFTSPLNSVFLELYPDTGLICSLFPVIEDSLGSFFDARLEEYDNWYINPPFTEHILERAAVRVLDALKMKRGLTFIFIGPSWRDAAFCAKLSQSTYLHEFQGMSFAELGVHSYTKEIGLPSQRLAYVFVLKS